MSDNLRKPIPIINCDITYGKSNYHIIVEKDSITKDITDLRPDMFLEGKDSYKKSIESINLLLAKYKNGEI